MSWQRQKFQRASFMAMTIRSYRSRKTRPSSSLAIKPPAQGDAVQLIVAEGQGHNFWEGFFRCQELIDFAIAKARDGAGLDGTLTDDPGIE